jgi:hypothetical protein
LPADADSVKVSLTFYLRKQTLDVVSGIRLKMWNNSAETEGRKSMKRKSIWGMLFDMFFVVLVFSFFMTCSNKDANINGFKSYVDSNFSECKYASLHSKGSMYHYTMGASVDDFMQTSVFTLSMSCNAAEDKFILKISCKDGVCIGPLDDLSNRMEFVRKNFLPWEVKDTNKNGRMDENELNEASYHLKEKIGLHADDDIIVEVQGCKTTHKNKKPRKFDAITKFYTKAESVPEVFLRDEIASNPVWEISHSFYGSDWHFAKKRNRFE